MRGLQPLDQPPCRTDEPLVGRGRRSGGGRVEGAGSRETLVTALGQRMKPLSSTMDLQPGVSHVEVAAPAFGDAEFTEVSNE